MEKNGFNQMSMQKVQSHIDPSVSKLQMNMIQKQKSEQKQKHRQTLDSEFPGQAVSENDEFFNQEDDMYDKRLQQSMNQQAQDMEYGIADDDDDDSPSASMNDNEDAELEPDVASIEQDDSA